MGFEFQAQQKAKDFARELFLSWDDDNSGVLEAGEILYPLLALGLSSDMQFAEKLLGALDPEGGQNDDLSLKIHDFIKIFKPDKNQ